MASISGTSSSTSSNSIYGTRNVITGLASGMDTESMIENAISAYRTKISGLSQQRTKLGWQQDAYRDIINKMAALSTKYTSYTSANNLMSTSFFDQAVKVTALGENASKVTASGRGSSDVSINGVRQLATAATYKLNASALMGGGSDGDYASIAAAGSFDLDKMTVSSFSGTMELTYGKDQILTFNFDQADTFESAGEMAAFMQEQLESQTISITGGGTKKASEMLTVEADASGNISFKAKANNNVYISNVSNSMQSAFSVSTGEGSKSFRVGALTKEVDSIDFLSESPMSITLDGTTKKINMPTKKDMIAELRARAENETDTDKAEALTNLADKIENGEALTDEEKTTRSGLYMEMLQSGIDKAFGKLTDKDGNEKSKLLVSNAGTENGEIRLKFESGQQGSTFAVSHTGGKTMGFGGKQMASYMDTSKTLKDILGEDGLKYVPRSIDKDGNTVYGLTINGVKIGDFDANTELNTIISRINSNKEAGVNISYSKLTNEFTFTAKETGAAGTLDLSEKGLGDQGRFSLGAVLFGGARETTKGQDAIFTATVDGTEMELTRSSNIVDFDGLSVTLKDTFGYKQAVNDDGTDKVDSKGNPVYTNELDRTAEKITFSTSSDADSIVEAVKSFVNDYNEMVTQIKNAYSTLPQQRSNGAYYEPLTDDEKADLSDSAIEDWEEKAKTGILFGDRDLSSLYSRLTSAVSMYGQDLADLKAAGISTSYSNGLTTLSFNEKTLRETLESDPNRVRDIFTKSKENGAKSDGLMAAIREPLETFAGTTGATKGTLIEKAGSPLAPTSIYSNYIQKQLDSLDTEITKWQDKMSDQVDYYTSQFSRLEQLISQMNSQSSTLAGLMGGY